MNLGILGGGQLGMMLCQTASKLGINTFIYTDSNDSPAINFSNSYLVKNYDDFKEIDNFIKGCDIITYEFENIPFTTLDYINKKLEVHPSPNINLVIQDRLTEKKYVNQLGIPTVPFVEIKSSDEISKLPNNYFPGILKTRKMGYDGKGQTVIEDPNQIQNVNNDHYILEKKIDLKKDLSSVCAILMEHFLLISQYKIFIKIKYYTNHHPLLKLILKFIISQLNGLRKLLNQWNTWVLFVSNILSIKMKNYSSMKLRLGYITPVI